MITLEQAKNLKHGDIIHQNDGVNADGTCIRWRVNGNVLLWKTKPNKIRVPLKHGLYNYYYLFQDVDQVNGSVCRGNLGQFHLEAECMRNSEERILYLVHYNNGTTVPELLTYRQRLAMKKRKSWKCVSSVTGTGRRFINGVEVV